MQEQVPDEDRLKLTELPQNKQNKRNPEASTNFDISTTEDDGTPKETQKIFYRKLETTTTTLNQNHTKKNDNCRRDSYRN